MAKNKNLSEVIIKARKDKFSPLFPSQCVYCGGSADHFISYNTREVIKELGNYSSALAERYNLGRRGTWSQYRGFEIGAGKNMGDTAWSSGSLKIAMQVTAEVPYCKLHYSLLEELRKHNPLGKGVTFGAICGLLSGLLAYGVSKDFLIMSVVGLLVGIVLSIILYRLYPPKPLSEAARDLKKDMLIPTNPMHELGGLGIQMKITDLKRSLTDFLDDPYYIIHCTFTNSACAKEVSELNLSGIGKPYSSVPSPREKRSFLKSAKKKADCFGKFYDNRDIGDNCTKCSRKENCISQSN